MSNTETTVTENTEANTDETVTENPNTEVEEITTSDEPIARIVPIPKTLDEAIEQFPKTANKIPLVAIPVLGELLGAVAKAGDITTELAANNQNPTVDEIVTFASAHSDEKVQALYKAMETKRRAFEAAQNSVVEAMKTILAETSLSAEEIAAMEVERKAVIEMIGNYKGALAGMTNFIDETEMDDFLHVVSEVKAPGMRNAKASGSSSTSEGYGKPRLNGGKVKVNGKEFASFPAAAKYLTSETNSNVTRDDVVESWCRAMGVTHWGDIKMGVTEFEMQPGFKVTVEKMAAE